jgi:hypothetical protein
MLTLKQFVIRNTLREASYAITFCDEENCRAVSPLGGVGFRPAKVANPEGGTLREAELRSSTPQTLPLLYGQVARFAR